MKKTTFSRKWLSVILAVMMVASFTLMSACGGEKAEDTTTTPPAATDDGAAADDSAAAPAPDPVNLTLTLHDPVESSNGQYLQSWADEVSAQTNGGLTITLMGKGTGAEAPEAAQAVETGQFDIGWVYTGYYPGQFPLTDVTTVPLAGFGDPVATTNALWDLYDKYPEVQAEWSKYQLLSLYGNPGMLLAGVEKKIEVPADVKGLTVRAPAGLVSDFIKAIGGVPRITAPPEIADEINSNIIQAYIFEPAGITNFKLQDQTKYYLDMPIYDAAFAIVVNQAKFDSLPQEYKDALIATSQREGSIKAAEDFKASAEAAWDVITAAGGERVTEYDKAVWQAIADPIIANWPKTEAVAAVTGFDAAAYLADAQATIAKYN